MRKKPFHLCRYQGCTRPTWSGKPEVLIELRTCARHSALARAAHRKLNAAKSVREVARTMRHPMPLVCVFPPYKLVAHALSTVPTIVRLGGICGLHAPRRRRGDTSRPRFPNRYGEPLCLIHRADGDDVYAFPDEPGMVALVAHRASEDRERHLARLQRLGSL